MIELNKIYNEDCIAGLKKLSDESIDCIVTSPPYFNLRDYQIDGQIGLEESPRQYVSKMLEVFTECKRVQFPEAHFATFPEEIPATCIKAGCPKDGIVLDPFMGSGTTAIVARKLDRNYIGFELNPDYCRIAEKMIHQELGMFA